MARSQALPPIDEHQRMENLLGELRPQAPQGVSIEPEWLPQLNGWRIWVNDAGQADSVAHVRFNHLAFDLADRYGVDLDIVPVEVKAWGHFG